MEELGGTNSLDGLIDSKQKIEQLKESFKWNDIKKFRQIIAGVDGSERVKCLQASDDCSHQSLFEWICATADRSKFIRECISVGCDTNKVNQKCGKRPLGFAVEAISSTNLEALLSDTSVGVDVKHSFQFPFTPINYFVKLISNNNFDEIYSCIELLLKHCADVNLLAENAKTPIQNVLESEHLDVDNKKKLMQCFLSEAKYVDVNEVHTRLIQLFPDLKLSPTDTQIDKEWTEDRFFECLHNEKEIDFLRGISFIAMNNQNRLTELLTIVHGNMTLLTLAIENAWKFSVEKIIRLSVDVTAKAGNFTPVEHAINAGHWEILELLLSSSKFDLSQYQTLLPTATAAQYTDRKPKDEKNYIKCFELLLNHSKIDVNAVDTLGYTALHYAIQHNDSKTIVDVLKRGAYIGIRDSLKHPLIPKIDALLLEKHFDCCITTTGKHSDQKEHELVFNLANFIPSQPKLDKARCRFRKRIYETEVLKLVSECKETEHLVRHPLIEGLLHWKLDGLNVILFANFSFFAIIAINTVWLIYWFSTDFASENIAKCLASNGTTVYDYPESCPTITNDSYFMYCSVLMLFVLFIREATQFIFSPWSYLKSLDNYLEIALVFFSLNTIGEQYIIREYFDAIYEERFLSDINAAYTSMEDEKRAHKTSAVITIFLITYEMFGLLGAIPFWSFSTHYAMLKSVTKNFFKCLLMYAIILVAFAMAFFILFNDANHSSNLSPITTSEATANFVCDRNNKTNPFSTVGLALFKVSTMAIGEIDAGSIDFNENTISYAVFAGFILLITTVLANLLNGLAVSNTTSIITEAKQTELIQRCAALARFEDGFFNIANRIGLTKLKSNAIRVRPNQNNRIVGENKKKCCGSARMSDSVVNEAFMLLKRVEMQEKEEIERKRIERQFLNIETLLEKLLQQRLN